MKKYYCDRCGNEVKDGQPFSVVYGLISHGERSLDSKDLCGSCYNELVDFIEGDKDDGQD